MSDVKKAFKEETTKGGRIEKVSQATCDKLTAELEAQAQELAGAEARLQEGAAARGELGLRLQQLRDELSAKIADHETAQRDLANERDELAARIRQQEEEAAGLGADLEQQTAQRELAEQSLGAVSGELEARLREREEALAASCQEHARQIADREQLEQSLGARSAELAARAQEHAADLAQARQALEDEIAARKLQEKEAERVREDLTRQLEERIAECAEKAERRDDAVSSEQPGSAQGDPGEQISLSQESFALAEVALLLRNHPVDGGEMACVRGNLRPLPGGVIEAVIAKHFPGEIAPEVAVRIWWSLGRAALAEDAVRSILTADAGSRGLDFEDPSRCRLRIESIDDADCGSGSIAFVMAPDPNGGSIPARDGASAL